MSLRKPLTGQSRLATRGQGMLDDHPAITTYEEGEIKNIPVADIKPNPDQPRKTLKKESLAELSQSIKDVGLLQPIIVKILDDSSIQLVAGQRRLEAVTASVHEAPYEVLLVREGDGVNQHIQRAEDLPDLSK